MDSSLKQSFAALIGERYVIDATADMVPYLNEARDLFHGEAACVLRPGTTQEVAEILKLCTAAKVSIVPQGGNTGLVGGQTPRNDREIVLSLGRLDRLREADPQSNTLTVEAGMSLARVQQEAAAVDRLFPLSLASEGSCTIGGNLATNAGGTAVLAYGNTRDLVSGIEVVLADGRVLSDLNKLKKDNTGYDLKNLFIGSEGTLGIITAAVLKLFPKPRSVATAFIGLATPREALDLLMLAQARAGHDVKTFELLPRIGIEYVVRHGEGARDPLDRQHLWYVLMEVASETDAAEATLMSILEAGIEKALIEDAVVAASIDQRQGFWRLRELLSEVQKFEGGSIKHDVSVPVADVPAFLEEVEKEVLAFIPGSRTVPFGHLGDGNIHWNLSQPVGADKAAFLAKWHDVNAIVHGIVARYHGSISAEHGIGVLKRDILPEVKNKVALDVMHGIKALLDPQGILNPGKVL